MLMRAPGGFAGFTLIELLIALAVIGILMAIGLPNISVWIQNTQLKTAAEGVVSGLQLARAEALRRNVSVRFSLVDSVSNGCAYSATGTSWVVSLTDPSGACGAAPSDIAAPFIVQKKSGAEGSPNATAAASGGTTAVFNGLGRLTGLGNLTQIDIKNPTGGACQPPDGTGQMRCLSVLVGNGGQVRMCDPAVPAAVPPAADDPRSCGVRPPYAFVP